MYRITITPVQNGWIINITFEGRVELTRVYSSIPGVMSFLIHEMPKLEKGFNETLKRWIKQ